MKIKNTLIPLFVAFALLTSCNNKENSLSSNASEDRNSTVSIDTPSASNPSVGNTSNSTGNSASLPPSVGESNGPVSGELNQDSFSLEDAKLALMYAVFADEDFKEVTISQYSNYESYRQKRSTKISSYLDVTLQVGTTVNYNYNNDITAQSNFREERTYDEGIYTQIKKFDNTFSATAYRYEMEPLEALINLNAGQGFNAYTVLNTFANEYNGIFIGEVLDDGSRHASYVYSGEIDDNLYQFLAGIEFTIDSKFHVVDFWYSEGYYDMWYDDYNTPFSMRKHGVYGVGYSYYIDSYVLGELSNYPLDLKFNKNDNFITEIRFEEESLEYSISETPEDENGYKTVNLIELLITNPQIGDFVKGCPINNLSFRSSNPDVIAINDGWYADFIGEGEATITVYDSAYGVTGSNTLTITLLP